MPEITIAKRTFTISNEKFSKIFYSSQQSFQKKKKKEKNVTRKKSELQSQTNLLYSNNKSYTEWTVLRVTTYFIPIFWGSINWNCTVGDTFEILTNLLHINLRWQFLLFCFQKEMAIHTKHRKQTPSLTRTINPKIKNEKLSWKCWNKFFLKGRKLNNPKPGVIMQCAK